MIARFSSKVRLGGLWLACCLFAGAVQAQRTALRGSMDPRARAAVDLGEAAPDLQVPRLTLRFMPTPARQAALDQLLADQQNPRSAHYRQWLTPEEFGRGFGLAPARLAQIAAWLTAQGFTVTGVARGRQFVSFSGSVAQIETAFGTRLHRVSLGGEAHFANLTDATLPVELAGETTALTGLNDFRMTPMSRIHAEDTSSQTGSHYVAPGDFAAIYDLNPLLGSSINGSGITIAVVGQTDISLADVAAFRAASGLTANVPTVKLFYSDPGTSAADVDEAQLDVEWAGAVAPRATILYVNSPDVLAGSLTSAIDNDLAPIVSMSYGGCEQGFGASNIAVYNQLLRQANAQGQTVVSAAGDYGATDCDGAVASATGGPAVAFPASSPYATAVGGTMFAENGGTYWNATNAAGGTSALGYIPETTWNETATLARLAAGGGGASAYFTKPAFQQGTGVPNDFSRDLPDVALNAGTAHDGYLFCSQGWCTNGFQNAAGLLDIAGGTSVATPAFAGLLAVLQQKIGAATGNANPTIYSLANSQYAANVFHDITSGTNASPCTAGSTGCPTAGTIGYSATKGYDLTTGWGSVDAFRLVSDWLLVSPLGTGSAGTGVSTTSLTASPGSVMAGGAVALTATVGSTAGTPTGTVQFLVDNLPAGAAVALAGGAASTSLATTGLGIGTHIVTAAYSGDSTFAGSKGAANLTIVAASAGDFTLSPASTAVSVAGGGTAPGVVFTVGSLNGFSGNVTLSASSTVKLAATYSFNIDPVTVPAGSSASTVLTLLAYVTNSRTGTGLMRWPAAAALGVLLLAGMRRRRISQRLLAVLVAAGLAGMVGCSSSSSSSSGSTLNVTNTPSGTYTLLVTATGANSSGTAVTHNAQVTFTVQ